MKVDDSVSRQLVHPLIRSLVYQLILFLVLFGPASMAQDLEFAGEVVIARGQVEARSSSGVPRLLSRRSPLSSLCRRHSSDCLICLRADQDDR